MWDLFRGLRVRPVRKVHKDHKERKGQPARKECLARKECPARKALQAPLGQSARKAIRETKVLKGYRERLARLARKESLVRPVRLDHRDKDYCSRALCRRIPICQRLATRKVTFGLPQIPDMVGAGKARHGLTLDPFKGRRDRPDHRDRKGPLARLEQPVRKALPDRPGRLARRDRLETPGRPG
jgi:hypothetical protein